MGFPIHCSKGMRLLGFQLFGFYCSNFSMVLQHRLPELGCEDGSCLRSIATVFIVARSHVGVPSTGTLGAKRRGPGCAAGARDARLGLHATIRLSVAATPAAKGTRRPSHSFRCIIIISSSINIKQPQHHDHHHHANHHLRPGQQHSAFA